MTLVGHERDLPNWALATLVLYLESKGGKAMHIEDLAIRLFEIAPTRYSWRKHADRIDLSIVRDSLSDAAKEKNGSLVVKSKDQMWTVSRSGQDWASTNISKWPEVEASKPIIAADKRTDLAVGRRREVDRLAHSEAYKKWHDGAAESITVYDFFAATRTSDYLPALEMTRRHALLADVLSEEPEMLAFVDELFRRFGKNYQGQNDPI